MNDLHEAARQFGNPEPISHAWLDLHEQRAQLAAAVSLPADQFLMLIAVARNGLRPKHIHARSDNGDLCAKCGEDLRSSIHLRVPR